MWLQIKIKTKAEFAEKLSNDLHDLGALSVTYEDAGNEPLYEPPLNESVLWNEVFISALFEQDTDYHSVVAALKKIHANESLCYSTAEIKDQSWEKAWMKNSKPMKFGQHLWIFPSYFPLENPPPQYIILDPGLAFGTGTHPTTALCLEWLDAHLSKGANILDYGCGSGILAIAALKLGAKKAWAVDHDPQALQATAENAQKNAISPEELTLFLPEDLPNIQVDVIMANILANPLIALASKFANLIKKDGTLVLSGILNDQIDIISAEYEKYFVIQKIDAKEEWLRVTLSPL